MDCAREVAGDYRFQAASVSENLRITSGISMPWGHTLLHAPHPVHAAGNSDAFMAPKVKFNVKGFSKRDSLYIDRSVGISNPTGQPSVQ